ncbi:1-phosphatidylinositol-3-phosphate 5-kinase [Linnemannia hyalina]|uniref:1-phosphatidylinositol-3-phosphate 5-kinase n=1 Tax=Linnemannia hyalina TaxID=64524 RepID=A0A9P8BQW9_9FUNG|nr:1-phosphatidylinositol-3-phosphate 5-kinase [Linnemannia hyalina]
MSALTSFDALHEPQSEDPPENVLSKIFQRVKSTLSTSHTAPTPTPPTSTATTTGVFPSSSSSDRVNTTSASSSSTSLHAGSTADAHLTTILNSAGGNSNSNNGISQLATVGQSDQYLSRIHDKASSTTSSSTSTTGTSETGSWVVTSDSATSSNNNSNNNGGTKTTLPNSSNNNTGARHGVLSTVDNSMDKASVVRRSYPATTSSTAPKRASSLFKVSTLDHSIVQSDDTAPLSSLAPPVMSFSPAFGGPSESVGAVMNRPIDRDNSTTRDYIHQTLGAKDASYDSDARSIRSFSSGHHKGNSLTKVIRRLRGEGVNKDYWMADENAKECFGCSASFFVFRRKHHCRICGHIFCSKCANKIIPGAKLGYEGYLRVCNYCLDIMQQYEQPENGPSDYTPGSSWPTPIPPNIHGHFSQQLPMSPSTNTNQQADGTPLDGIRKFLHAGSNLFLARSRSNTTTGDQIDGNIAPFRRSLALEDGHMNDSVLDPEIAPFMGEEDDDDGDDLWPSNSPNPMGFLSLHGPHNDPSSDDDFSDYGPRDKTTPLRAPRAEDIRDMFAKDRSPINRRISIKGNRPNRNLSLSLKTRGLLRPDGVESARSPMDIRPSSPFLTSGSQSLMHTNRHSRAASMVTSAVELNSASLQHMRRLLRQLLTRFEIDSADGWEDVIMKLVLKVSNSIQILGIMDVMQVVKIKKIPGGTAQDTLYIDGVVCTKNLAHKQMSRTLQNPRILILKFALEYQRIENHFISLEPIVKQEKEYLQHLVARIVALSPHVVIVEKTVSRLALELLLTHNVAVAYNVKPEVTEAIAHSTGADIILSFDKLGKEPRLGTCGTFEVKTFVHELIPNKRKSYMFFQDCPGNLFCSLVLRGGCLETLNRIKKVVRLMVWVSYHLKLETSLMSDQFAMTSAMRDSQMADEEKVDISPDLDISRLQEYLIPYKKTILSASPFVRFNPPFLLVQMIDDAEKLKKIEQSATPSSLREIGNAKITFATSSATAIVTKSTGRSQDSGFVEGAYIDISNDFQSKSKAWEDFLSTNIGPPHIAPFAYQNLTCLFSNVCTVTKATCDGPIIRLIQYYVLDSDVTLANYLEQICWEANYICPSSSCDRPLRDHQRIYAHGDAKVVVTIEQWDSLTALKKDSIMMWSRCKVCNVETPQVYISDDTKNYSFGKFLELIFYQTNLTCRANFCPHDINRNHVRYFGVDTQLVRIERIPIRLYDINFPPMLVRCKPEFSARTKNQELDLVRSLITRYWDSVMERIKNCIFDVVHPSKIEAAKQELLEMSRNVVVEKKAILQLLQQTYLNSAPTDTLALNMVRIKLYEKAVGWNKTFGDFAREYFNPDRDFRRRTSQLRRLFDEKEFPVASDRAHHAGLMNDLPMTLDFEGNIESPYEDSYDFTPSDLPYLGSSPTLDIAKPKVEQGDVAALENAIQTATSQIAFPFMEPKVTRRLSMNLMQEFRPKLTQTLTSESILTVTDEDLNEKTKPKESPMPPVIPRIPLPASRQTTRVSSRLSMVSLPTFDPMSLMHPDRKDMQNPRSGVAGSTGVVSILPVHSGQASPHGAMRNLGERMIIPLARTPTSERPGAISSSPSTSGKNPFFFNKPRARRPSDMPSSGSSSTTTSAVSTLAAHERGYPSTNNLSSATSLSNRRSLYLARAQGGGIPIPTTNPSSSDPPGRHVIGNRHRAQTQPTAGPNGNARGRYVNPLSNRIQRPLETKLPAIEVFSSVNEATKEESDDDEDYQSEGEGDEPYQPRRGYTFSLIQTDAMDEALGSEDPSTMEATASMRNTNGAGGAGPGQGSGNGDDFFIDPIMMMFLGDDDYTEDQQQQHQQKQQASSTTGGATTNARNHNASSSTVGSPPTKSSSVNMSVTGTLTAALAAASKLQQLSEVAEGVERGSLMKTLSNFWQDRNSPNFTPLEYPMQPFEHVFHYSQIIVREDEPSSIIALTLSSPQYVDKLKGIFRGDSTDADNSNNATAPMSTSGTATPAEEPGSYDSNGNSLMSSASATEGIYEDIQVFDDSLLSEPGTHMKFPFLDGSTMLYCKIFYMEQFHALRKAAGCEYSYIQSLARCMKWDTTGGKSGSSFLKTRDDRFIMKQLSKIELEAFIKFAPHYFRYMQEAIYHKQPTVLAKIFGFYRVGYKHGALGRSMNMDVLIMENLFYDRKNLQVYDLKGSRRNRFVQPSGKENEVLLDENFIEYMSESPFFIREHAKMQLNQSLVNDSQFLQRFNIMDYSLLVAIADDKKELLVGIVDFIRPFTWDKKLESWVKDAVGSKEPTIVSPAQYKKRFRSAMNRHLDMVPDRWFGIETYFVDSTVHRSIGRSQQYQLIKDTEQEYDRQQQQQQQQQKELGPEGYEQQKKQGQMQLHQHHQYSYEQQRQQANRQGKGPSRGGGPEISQQHAHRHGDHTHYHQHHQHHHSRYSTSLLTDERDGSGLSSRPSSSIVN